MRSGYFSELIGGICSGDRRRHRDLRLRDSPCLEGFLLLQQIDLNLRQKTQMFALHVNGVHGLSGPGEVPRHLIPSRFLVCELIVDVSRAAGARATVIDAQGKVLADSEADPAVDGKSRPAIRVCGSV